MLSPAYRGTSTYRRPQAPPALPQAIIKLIDNCKSTQRLNLSNHNLNNSDVEEILKYVTERKITVKTLDLGKNQLTRLPESIGQLKSLRYLSLDNNQLAALPKSIGQLKSLEGLYLGINQLSTLPESIGQLAALKNLILSNNQLATLPESIGQLESLEELYLKRNYLTIPPIQLQVGITVTIEDQKNKENLIAELQAKLQKAQKEKQIIHDKVLNYTGKPLGQFSFQELVVSILNPLEKPITINNKSMHSLTSYLNALEKYQDKFLSIKTAIDHLKKIASEKNWEIPDSVAEVAT